MNHENDYVIRVTLDHSNGNLKNVNMNHVNDHVNVGHLNYINVDHVNYHVNVNLI